MYKNGFLSRFDESIYEKLKKMKGDEDEAMNEGLEEEIEAIEEEEEEEDENEEEEGLKIMYAFLMLFLI